MCSLVSYVLHENDISIFKVSLCFEQLMINISGKQRNNHCSSTRRVPSSSPRDCSVSGGKFWQLYKNWLRHWSWVGVRHVPLLHIQNRSPQARRFSCSCHKNIQQVLLSSCCDNFSLVESSKTYSTDVALCCEDIKDLFIHHQNRVSSSGTSCCVVNCRWRTRWSQQGVRECGV